MPIKTTPLYFFAASVLVNASAFAQTPAAPAGSTALCRDGTYSTASERRHACAGHKGIKRWMAKAAPAVQNQSAAVRATGAAPTTGEPSRTPATPARNEAPVQAPSKP